MKNLDEIMLEDVTSEAATKRQELDGLAARGTGVLIPGAGLLGAISGATCAGAVFGHVLSGPAKKHLPGGKWTVLIGGGVAGASIAAATASALVNEVRSAATHAALQIDQNHLERVLRQRAQFQLQGDTSINQK